MIPNIYKGNYYIALLPPLLLIILALYSIFTNGVKLGVDFEGGTLVTLQIKNSIDADWLKARLSDEGFANPEVNVFQTTYGYKAEVEFAQSEEIKKAEGLKAEFQTLLPEVSRLEVRYLSSGENAQEYEQKKQQLYSIAEDMVRLAGSGESVKGKNLNELNSIFSSSYNLVYKNYEQKVASAISKYVPYEVISVQTVSPALSTQFIEKAGNVVLFSAILSTVFVFFVFRTFVPSAAVLIGAFSDVIIALGAMSFFGVPLTLASFAALLMLVGYSLDTDILLTMRMLKREGDPREKAFDAMKTGITMSSTAIVAFSALFILAYFTRISTYYEISSLVICGLIGDILATWGINAVILLHHVLGRR
jgi:preprotein translocase subunit SecF